MKKKLPYTIECYRKFNYLNQSPLYLKYVFFFKVIVIGINLVLYNMFGTLFHNNIFCFTFIILFYKYYKNLMLCKRQLEHAIWNIIGTFHLCENICALKESRHLSVCLCPHFIFLKRSWWKYFSAFYVASSILLTKKDILGMTVIFESDRWF